MSIDDADRGYTLGKLNQQQFITGVQRCIPNDQLEELLTFNIIPSHLLDEANAVPSLPGSTVNIRKTIDTATQDYLSDEQLRMVANQTSRKNWSRLALVLGFLEYDIEAYRVRNKGDAAATVSTIEKAFSFDRSNEWCF
jgi:hypothetical protein